MRTNPDVFIIESLDPDDEGNGRLEGVMLSNMLNFHEKKPKYRYVRTRKQFLEAVNTTTRVKLGMASACRINALTWSSPNP